MLIDLERNDLGRVCAPGSVEVDELMTVESYAHVHHIVSNVRGALRDGVTPGEVIRAVFPGGTITGCPKVRCMQIIAELEGEGRGAYTGAMGWLNRDGDLDLNILIRSADWLDPGGRTLRFRTGAGIVADSDPQRELDETRAKARGMLRALGSRRVSATRRARAFSSAPSRSRASRRAIVASPTATACSRPCARIAGRVPWWDAHWARLVRGAQRLRLRAARRRRRFVPKRESLLAGAARAVLKLVVSRGAGGRGYAPPTRSDPDLGAVAPSAAAAVRAEGLALRWCEHAAVDPARAGRHQALQPAGAGAGARRMGRRRRSTKA